MNQKKGTKEGIPAVNPNKNKESKIYCMYTNEDTLTNKMPELKGHIVEHQPFVIAVTEVIPKNYRIPGQKADIKVSDDYDVFPDSILSKGRGITIQVHKTLKAQEVNFTTSYEESLWCEVNLMEHDKLLIGCIYRSESGSSDNNCKLDDLLKEASKKGYSHILIMGDFNYKRFMEKFDYTRPK